MQVAIPPFFTSMCERDIFLLLRRNMFLLLIYILYISGKYEYIRNFLYILKRYIFLKLIDFLTHK